MKHGNKLMSLVNALVVSDLILNINEVNIPAEMNVLTVSFEPQCNYPITNVFPDSDWQLSPNSLQPSLNLACSYVAFFGAEKDLINQII